MDQGIKARWLAALRDPGSRQTTKVLGRVDGTRCCLGVLCDLAVQDEVIPPPIPSPEAVAGEPDALAYGAAAQGDLAEGDVSEGYLPDRVHTWARFGISDDAHRLADMNDSGRTFAEIADHIEDTF